MEESEGFGFDDFAIEMEEIVVERTKKYDRNWKVGPGGSILQRLIIHDDMLFFGSANFNMYAVDASNGKLIWKTKTEGMILESSPFYWEGKLYVGSHDFNLYCFDAKDGKILWKFRTNGQIDGSPFVSKGKVFFGSKDRFVYALDASSGNLLWKFETQGGILSSATVQGSRVFIGSFDHNLYCLDTETGKVIWKFETQGEVNNFNPFLVHENKVLFGSWDNYLRAVDISTGRPAWRFKTGNYGNASAPCIYRDVIYHTDRDGHLFALTLDGKLIWKFTNKMHLSVPLFHDDMIFVGSEDFNLYCISLEGKTLWSYKVEAPPFIRGAIRGGSIIFPSWDCNIYALEISTRRLLWKFKAEGGPCYLPPPYEDFEVKFKIPESTAEEVKRKGYDLNLEGHEGKVGSFYKSRITYNVSTQYAEKGKYQVDSDEEEF